MTGQTNNHKTKFFLAIGVIGLFAVLTGFSTTFLIPLGKGTFEAPLIIYIMELLRSVGFVFSLHSHYWFKIIALDNTDFWAF